MTPRMHLTPPTPSTSVDQAVTKTKLQEKADAAARLQKRSAWWGCSHVKLTILKCGVKDGEVPSDIHYSGGKA